MGNKVRQRTRPPRKRLLRSTELAELRARLREAEEALRAIRAGEVDAVLVDGHKGRELFTVKGADWPYRILVEAMNEGAITLHPDGTILYCNGQFANLVKARADDLIGSSIRQLIKPSSLSHFESLLMASQAGGAKGKVNLLSIKQELVPVNLSLHPIGLGDERAFCTIVTDLTLQKRQEESLEAANQVLRNEIEERKRAEAILELQTRELIRSNEDLERFAYAASHDLKEPLRMISSFTKLLAQRYKGRLDEDADEFIEYVVDGVARMEQLIRDVLAYAKIGSNQVFLPISCEGVLRGVLQNLTPSIQEHEGTVTYGALPVIYGNATELAQLFQNLIGNALKFRSAAPPRIHVSATKKPMKDLEVPAAGARSHRRATTEEWLFSVLDNGIGFELEYAERIFMMFKRLHDRSEYPGTGIGLALCKKIVEGHGGHIWAESAPGKGATFFFTMPVLQETAVSTS